MYSLMTHLPGNIIWYKGGVDTIFTSGKLHYWYYAGFNGNVSVATGNIQFKPTQSGGDTCNIFCGNATSQNATASYMQVTSTDILPTDIFQVLVVDVSNNSVPPNNVLQKVIVYNPLGSISKGYTEWDVSTCYSIQAQTANSIEYTWNGAAWDYATNTASVSVGLVF